METRNDPNARVPLMLPVSFPLEEGVGTLCIVGGGGTPQIVIDEFFRIAGNANARVLHILGDNHLSGYSEPARVLFRVLREESRLVRVSAYLRATVAETDEFARPLDQATGVWMGGGCQIRLSELFRNTPVHEGINGVLSRGGIVSGTSSGAASCPTS